MRRYELMVIFPLEEDQHTAGRERLLGDLAANGVEIEKTDELGDRDLAYEIKKRNGGSTPCSRSRRIPPRSSFLTRLSS